MSLRFIHLNEFRETNQQKIKMNSKIWNLIETHIGEELPRCVIKILDTLGYSNSISISAIQPADIISIENYINEEEKSIVDDFDCCNAETYQNQKTFRLLPGHRQLILNLKNHLHDMQAVSQPNYQLSHLNEFSILLKTLIETAERNVNKIPTQYRYNEIIRYFSVYIYLQCGKMCYETLCRNLPLPQSSAIRKYKKH